jgi:hypothetical protein
LALVLDHLPLLFHLWVVVDFVALAAVLPQVVLLLEVRLLVALPQVALLQVVLQKVCLQMEFLHLTVQKPE